MDPKRRNGVATNLPPSKRLQATNGPPVDPAEPMDEEDEDVFLEETLLRDEELHEFGNVNLASQLAKWRRPAVANFDPQAHSIGTYTVSVIHEADTLSIG
jgi:DNA polymerase delta subunit 1